MFKTSQETKYVSQLVANEAANTTATEKAVVNFKRKAYDLGNFDLKRVRVEKTYDNCRR